MYGNPYLPQLQTMQAQLAQLQGSTPQTQSQAISQGYQIQTVKGIAGARAFVIPPSSSVVLMDTDSSVFYVKTTDANGLETVKAYEFSEKEIELLKSNGAKIVSLGNRILRTETASIVCAGLAMQILEQ